MPDPIIPPTRIDPNDVVDVHISPTGITAPDPTHSNPPEEVDTQVDTSSEDDDGQTDMGRILEREAAKIRKRNNVTGLPEKPERDDKTGRWVKGGKKPAAPAVKPAATQSPTAKPAPTAVTPPAAPAPQKIKVGGKEYTEDELKQLLSRPQQPAAPPQAQQPAAPAQKPPAAQEDEKQAEIEEQKFVDNYMQSRFNKPIISQQEYEQLVLGEKAGYESFSKALNAIGARAVLEARRSIFGDMNPILDQFQTAMVPLIQNQAQIERYSTRQEFLTKYPEFGSNPRHTALAEQVAEQYVAKYPDIISRVGGKAEFLDLVAKQTDEIIQSEFLSWNPGSTQSWKDYVKSAQQKPAAPAATVPQQPPPQAKPRVRVPPPSGISPSGAAVSLGDATGRGFQKSVAAGLVD